MRPNLQLLADKQSGVFTRQQALCEYTEAEIRTLLTRGLWERVFQGVFREASTPRTPALAVEAARLSTGSCAVAACRQTAAAFHGISVVKDPTTHILSASPRTTRASGLVVHRDSVTDDDLVEVNGVWTTNAARTAIDLGRTCNRLDALAVLDLALRRGSTREELAVELGRHRGKRGVRQATELLDYASGKSESPMESRTRMRCIDGGLPHPEPQLIVSAGGVDRRLDLGWEKWKIGLEYDSREWHAGVDAAMRDNPRHNWLIDQGWLIFYATASQVYRHPELFLGPIRRAIGVRG